MTPRLRVLPLPDVVEGEQVRTPFALVLDRAAGMDLTVPLVGAAQDVGAVGFLVFDVEVELD